MGPKQMMESWVEQVWNRRNADYVREHLADPCPIHGMTRQEPFTPEDFIGFQQQMLGLIDGMRVEILDILEEGSKVVGIARVTGTSNDRPVDFTFGFSATVEDDRIVVARNAVDFLSFLVQRGSVPERLVEAVLG